MAQKDLASMLANKMVDGVLKKASDTNPGGKEPAEGLDEGTKKKLIQRELKMAADTDYALEELAKEQAAKKMRDALQGGGKPVVSESGAEKPKRWMVADGKPVEDTEGEYESFGQAYKVAALEASKVAALLEAAKKSDPASGKKDEFTDTLMRELAKKAVESLAGSGSSNSDVKQLRAELSSLREELRQSSDPLEVARKYNEFVQVLKGAGLVPESSPGTTTLEELRETHRHEETMEQLKADLDHKKEVRKLFSEIPTKIGRGMAQQIREGEMEVFECPKCHAAVYVPPNAGETVTCGGCRTIYAREKNVESSQKSGTDTAGGVGAGADAGGPDQPSG